MRRLVARALSVGADPSDDEEQRLRKILLLTAAFAILPLAIVWGGIYAFAGATGAGLIPWTYAALSALSIGAFAVVRTYWWFGLSQLAPYLCDEITQCSSSLFDLVNADEDDLEQEPSPSHRPLRWPRDERRGRQRQRGFSPPSS